MSWHVFLSFDDVLSHLLVVETYVVAIMVNFCDIDLQLFSDEKGLRD